MLHFVSLFQSRLLCELPGMVVRQTVLFIFVIGGDDALHQHMAHHVRGRQAADLDILHAVEHADGLFQTADLVARQVDLRDIAGDDDLRAEAQARQEHLHLLARGVLRLVENDEAVVERPAAHVGQRRDLDVAALEIFADRSPAPSMSNSAS